MRRQINVGPKCRARMSVRAKRIGVSLEEYIDRTAQGQCFCTKCKAWKARHGFRRDKKNYSGCYSWCRECQAAADAKRWREKEAKAVKCDMCKNKAQYVSVLRGGVYFRCPLCVSKEPFISLGGIHRKGTEQFDEIVARVVAARLTENA